MNRVIRDRVSVATLAKVGRGSNTREGRKCEDDECTCCSCTTDALLHGAGRKLDEESRPEPIVAEPKGETREDSKDRARNRKHPKERLRLTGTTHSCYPLRR